MGILFHASDIESDLSLGREPKGEKSGRILGAVNDVDT